MRVLLLIGVLCVAGCRDEPAREGPAGAPALELVVELDDKGGLEAGAPVKLRGFDVGVVESVALKRRVEIEVRIAAEHRDAVRSEAYGRIRDPMVGEPYLELIILDPDSPPVADRTVLPGADSDTEAALFEGRQKARELGESFKERAGELSDRAGETVREGADKAGELARDAGDKARETYRAVRDSEAVEKGAEAVKEGARKVRELFE